MIIKTLDKSKYNLTMILKQLEEQGSASDEILCMLRKEICHIGEVHNELCRIESES